METNAVWILQRIWARGEGLQEEKGKMIWQPKNIQPENEELTKEGEKALCFDGQGSNIASSSRPSEQEME